MDRFILWPKSMKNIRFLKEITSPPFDFRFDPGPLRSTEAGKVNPL
jgi:hypothetical protein